MMSTGAARRSLPDSPILRIGPADHGRPIALGELLRASGIEGYRYELIDGRVYVSPLPDLPQDRLEEWISNALRQYAADHPEVVNFVTTKARVFVPGRRAVTCPEPDVAAFRGFPHHLPLADLHWEDISPMLVVEIMGSNPEKDLGRNVELYLQVPSIREYWVIDSQTEGADRPHLIVHRRWGRRWRRLEFGPGDVYSTRLLPGFSLTIDPRS